MEEIRYGESDDEISGILFDGAWLWEEYVNTLLCHQGFLHPENRKKTGRICLFTDGSGFRYPDFTKIILCWMQSINDLGTIGT